jgi:hypothetical protein
LLFHPFTDSFCDTHDNLSFSQLQHLSTFSLFIAARVNPFNMRAALLLILALLCLPFNGFAQHDSLRKKPITWTHELHEVVIKDVRKPDTIVASPLWMIRDFHFSGDSLLLLSWEKNPDKCSLRVYSRAGKELAVQAVNDVPLGFFKDVYQQLYLECKAATYRLNFYAGGIYFQAMDEAFFYNAIRPTVAATPDYFFVSSYHPRRPEFAFMRSNRLHPGNDTLLEVRDEHLADLYYAEYKFLPFKTQCALKRKSRETGLSKYELAAEFTGFTQSLWWHPLYSPLLRNDSSLMIFDHYRDSLFCYSENGALERSVPLRFHKDKSYKKEIIQDEVTKELYALHFRAGKYSIAPIRLTDASEGPAFPLHYRYVEHIRIRNAKVYYIYRPFESLQNTFIYSEEIPQTQFAER